MQCSCRERTDMDGPPKVQMTGGGRKRLHPVPSTASSTREGGPALTYLIITGIVFFLLFIFLVCGDPEAGSHGARMKIGHVSRVQGAPCVGREQEMFTFGASRLFP